MEEEKKKLLLLFIFSTYLPVFLLQFRSGELVGCGIKFLIQRVPTRHTFYGPRYPKNKKYLKKHDDDILITFFRYFLFLGYWAPSKVCWVGTCWMQNLVMHPMNSRDRKLSKNTGKYVENKNKRSSFFFSSSKINKYYFIIFLRRPILIRNFL